MTRRLMAAILVMLASIVPAQIAAPASAAGSSVTWSVDHSAKVITVGVNLTFTGLNARGEPFSSHNDITSITQRVADIEAAIKKVWDGQKFKCYTLRVVINSKIVSTISGTQLGEVPITLLHTRTPSVRRSFFDTGRPNPLGESPSDAFEPSTGSWNGTGVWPIVGSDQTYGRLFGQVLGLHPTFDGASGGPLAGAPNDVMSGGSTRVAPETMTRLIRRSTLNEADLKCPLTADLAKGTAILTFFAHVQVAAHFWACDYDPPSSDPQASKVINFVGRMNFEGDYATILGSGSAGGDVSGSGTWEYQNPELTLSAGVELRQGVRWGPVSIVATGNAIMVSGGAALPIAGRLEFKDGATECA